MFSTVGGVHRDDRSLSTGRRGPVGPAALALLDWSRRSFRHHDCRDNLPERSEYSATTIEQVGV